ncbi:hypothetical protein [Flavobacterium sp. JP2137]|uniref:hypothetical protein n=1 Tax=Flavobacterium sp. JP2137 TaxID=3414510 RepID=UPI003D2F9C77
MLRPLLALLCFFFVSALEAQERESLYSRGKWKAESDTINLQTGGLNPSYFRVLTADRDSVPATAYQMDFQLGQLTLLDAELKRDSLTIEYLRWPDFLTRTYTYYPAERIVANAAGQQLFAYKDQSRSSGFIPFEGLNTAGSISRGFTVGNNQNGVMNSNLDLQITGKLSDKVHIRASIQDSNAPLQDGGYSQKIDEFDQIFMELFADNWSIKAGDIFLENRKSRFLNFNKKVQGLSTSFTFKTESSKTIVEAAGALARGQYAKSSFVGQEGNQGPYKLKGPNGELFILIISGSERVYVNGIALKRGENNDYVIDYNAGEIRFTTLFPITSDMRIAIEYQYTDRNYTRFVGYGGIQHERESWHIGGYVFTETDIKNQPLQQNLSETQIETLKQAGNDPNKMIAPSAYPDVYSENKILYKEAVDDLGVPYFVYSNNPDDALFSVQFSLVGNQNGDYQIQNSQSIGKIYQYVPAVNGVKQGNYAPVTRLIAPVRNTIMTLLGGYSPSEKTAVKAEIAVSNNDENLFSAIDDEENKGWATQVNAKQRLYTGSIWIDAFADFQFIHRNFKSLEQLYSIEFDRDWNLDFATGNQSLISGGFQVIFPEKGQVGYRLEQLDYGDAFTGSRHHLDGSWNSGAWKAHTRNSVLNAESATKETRFLRSQSDGRFHFDKNWVGARLDLEDQQETELGATRNLLPLSHRFTEVTAYIGRGDSTAVFAEIGYSHRINDSIQLGALEQVSTSHTFYLKSKWIQTQNRDLSFYANYRILNWSDSELEREKTLNSRMVYNDRFWDGLVQTSTVYETSSGSIAQQEYTYIEVEPGRGIYMWVDYNNNGIQELEEFEVAPFPDQAKYVRLYLPNQVFVKTHQNKFSQSLMLNPINWQNTQGYKRLLSHFSNQTAYSIDRRDLRKGDGFNFNPFTKDDEQLVGLNESFRNSLFYNRGRQKHSVTYTYLKNRTKNLLSFGAQENQTVSHQLMYSHLIAKTWLMALSGKTANSETNSDTYESKNYAIENRSIEPRISYLFSRNASLDLFYELQKKENVKADFEALTQHRLGTSFMYTSNNNFTVNGEVSLYKNDFTGNSFSPVAYQMLEGLQPGKNITWRLMVQRNLTRYLDLNLNYQGRTTEEFATIHTGNIQLRAFF